MTSSATRFSSILLVGPADPATVGLVGALAERNDAAVACLQVAPELPRIWDSIPAMGKPIDLESLYLREHERRLEEQIAPLRSQGISVAVKAVTGTPFLEIIREVMRNEYDLVVMTADGGTEPHKRLFGSTSMKLVRKCPCPVWIVKPGQPAPPARVLAAVDPDPSQPARDGLNGDVLEWAVSIAAEPAELHVLHVWWLAGEKMMLSSGGFNDQQIYSLAQQEGDSRRRAVQALVERHGARRARIHVITGEDPANTITDVAAKIGADLVVLGTLCRTGIAGFVIGNTAEQVLGEINCSVLMLKPRGFRSPVSPRD